MQTTDRIRVAAPIDRVFSIASDVERWPQFLPHYRWVRMHERHQRGGRVEMAAWRTFGILKYPTWWLSEMEIARAEREVRYRHVGGITRGMDVVWRLEERAGGVDVTLLHVWSGPDWPLIGAIAADWVIGPIFIHGIASRTLAGVKRKAEIDA